MWHFFTTCGGENGFDYLTKTQMKKYWPFNQELQALDCMIGNFQTQLKKIYFINNALPIKTKTVNWHFTGNNMKKQGGLHDDMEITATVQNEEKTLMNKKFSFLNI